LPRARREQYNRRMTIRKWKWLAVVLASAIASLAVADASAQLGKPAPAFKLLDTEGKEVSLASLKGKTVVLEWYNPDCPFSKHAHTKGPLRDLAKRVASDKVVWLSINSSAPGKQGYGEEHNRRARREYAISNPVLLDEDGEVGRAYGAEKTPHLFVIDAQGVLRYRGGLDNAPMGVVDDQRPRLPGTAAGTVEPYVEDALQDLKQKRSVRLRETPAYGCSVKYVD
jgi:peroxiredoxin